jgi:hypothetical protein
MDPKFHPSMAAIKTDDLERFRALIDQDPSLATSRSSVSHPTLLQCLVLSGNNLVHKLEMARLLVNAGADLNGPLGACSSCDNIEVAELLLDSGAILAIARWWISSWIVVPTFISRIRRSLRPPSSGPKPAVIRSSVRI